MVALEATLTKRLRKLRVQVETPDDDTVVFRNVPADSRVFNKPRTNLLVKRTERGMPRVVCVDEDLEYAGDDQRLARAFAGASRRQGWRILLLPESGAGDLGKAVEEALGILSFKCQTVADSPDSGASRGLLAAFGTDLSGAELTVGRADEIEHIVASVLGWRPRLALIAGDSGVGKTNLLHAVARRLGESRPELRMISASLAAVMAGTCLEAERENLLATLLKGADGEVLALEHVELALLPASRGPWLLADAVDRGARLIGTTLPAQLDSFRVDPLARRLEVVQLSELDAGATIEVLRGLREKVAQHHRVMIGGSMLDAVVERSLSVAGRLPAKAVRLLDAAAARAALAGVPELGLYHVYLAGSELPEVAAQ